MSDNTCNNCANLQAQLDAARREIATLRTRIRQLERIIQTARYLCQTYIAATHPIISRKSGVPRGKWSYAKGVYRVAAHILSTLNQ